MPNISKPQNNKINLTPFILIPGLIIIAMVILSNLNNKKEDKNPVNNLFSESKSLIKEILPQDKLVLASEEIEIKYTDNNDNETFIIKTDKEKYNQSLTSAEIYFSVTNLGVEEIGNIKFAFEGGEEVVEIEVYDSSASDTSSSQGEENNKISLPALPAGRLTKEGQGVVDEWQELKLENYTPQENSRKKTVGDRIIKNQAKYNFPKGTTFFKATTRFPFGTVSEFFIEVYGDNGGYGHLDPIFGNAGGGTWTKKHEIQINPDFVDGVGHNNFPVLLDENNFASDVFTTALNTGCDLRFSSNSEGSTELPYEKVTYATTPDAEIWVKIPTLSGAATTSIWVWYGNSSATCYAVSATYGAHNVWDTNYKMVQHMKDDTTLTISDSTSNVNNGTKGGDNSPIEATGNVAKAQNFDTSDDYIAIVDNNSLDLGSQISISAWIKPNSLSSSYPLIVSKFVSVTDRYEFYLDSSDGYRPEFVARSLAADGANTAPVVDQWMHTAVVYNGTTAQYYYNGTSDGSYDSEIENTGGDDANIAIGDRTGGGGVVPVYSVIDEIRISNIVRSTEWIATEYDNQNSPATFAIEQTPTNTRFHTTTINSNTILKENIKMKIGGYDTVEEVDYCNPCGSCDYNETSCNADSDCTWCCYWECRDYTPSCGRCEASP